jgi:hypothetical protein
MKDLKRRFPDIVLFASHRVVRSDDLGFFDERVPDR